LTIVFDEQQRLVHHAIQVDASGLPTTNGVNRQPLGDLRHTLRVPMNHPQVLTTSSGRALGSASSSISRHASR
jgi:hypothetical protein